MSVSKNKTESKKKPTTAIVERILTETNDHCLANVLLTIAETGQKKYNLQSMKFNTKNCKNRPGGKSFCSSHREIWKKKDKRPYNTIGYDRWTVSEKLMEYTRTVEFDFLRSSEMQEDRERMVKEIIEYATDLRQKYADLMDIAPGSEQIEAAVRLDMVQRQYQSTEEQLQMSRARIDEMKKENENAKDLIGSRSEKIKRLQTALDSTENENEDLQRQLRKKTSKMKKYAELFEDQKETIEEIREYIEKTAIINRQKMDDVFATFEFPKYPDFDGRFLFSDRIRKVIKVDTIDLLRAPAIEYPSITDSNFRQLLYARVFTIPMIQYGDDKNMISVIDYAEKTRNIPICQSNQRETVPSIPQMFLPFYFNPESPYKSLLIYHNVGTGKTRTLFNIMKKFQTDDWKRIFVTTTKLRNDYVSRDPHYKDVKLTWPDKKPGEVFTRNLFGSESKDPKEFHSDRYKIEVLTYEELYQLLTRTQKDDNAGDDKIARDLKIYGPFSDEKRARSSVTRGKRAFFNDTDHRYRHLKDYRRTSGQPPFSGGRYVQETRFDFLKKTILVFDEIHTAHIAMLDFLRECFMDSIRKSQADSVRCVFASATPFEQGNDSAILILRLLLSDLPSSMYDNFNTIAQFLDEKLYSGRISYFGYSRNTENGDFAKEIVDPENQLYEWDGHKANLIKITVPDEFLKRYKRACGDNVPETGFDLKYIASHAPDDFYARLKIPKSRLPRNDRLSILEEKSRSIEGGPEYIKEQYRSFLKGCLSHHISVGKTPQYQRKEFRERDFRVAEHTKMRTVIDKIKALKGKGLQVLYSGVNYKQNNSSYASTGESIWEMIQSDTKHFEPYRFDKSGRNRDRESKIRVAFIGKRQKNAADESENFKEVFNDTKNKDGDYIGLIVLDNSVTQGVSLFNVRHMHILEYGNTEAEMTQVVGRSIRLCGHRDLEKKNRTLNIYIYTHDGETPPESDESTIKDLTRVMEKMSIDQGLYISQEEIKAANNRSEMFLKRGYQTLSQDVINNHVVYFPYRYPLVFRYPHTSEIKNEPGQFFNMLTTDISDILNIPKIVYNADSSIEDENSSKDMTRQIARWFNIYEDLNFPVKNSENGDHGRCWPVFELEDRSMTAFDKIYDQKDLSGLLGIIYIPKLRSEHWFVTFGTSYIRINTDNIYLISAMLGRIKAKDMKLFFTGKM